VTGRHKRAARRENVYRIPVINNRYELPCNSEVCETQVFNSAENHEVRKHHQKKKKHRILIIGDNHGRECASKIMYNLDSDFEVQGIIKSGADLMAITNKVKEEVKLLTKNDVVVVWGGTRDVGRNETTSDLNQLKDFFKKNNHTNIIQMCVPHRYDLYANSCVNREVEVFNRKLCKLVKAFEYIALIKLDLNRELFTKHGLHMNGKGKESVAKKIMSTIKHMVLKK
jgi:hypothetical protein